MNKNPCHCSFLISFVFLWLSESSAQWVQTSMQKSGHVTSFAVSGATLYATTDNYGITSSSTNGETWTSVDAGYGSRSPSSMIISKASLFVGTYGYGAFFSLDTGATWSYISAGTWTGVVNALALSDTTLFLATTNGIRRASAKGAAWNPANVTMSNRNFNFITIAGTKTFAGAEGGGIYHSGDNGLTWNFINDGLPASNVLCMAANDSILLAGTVGKGAYRSANGGVSWTAVNTGLTDITVYSFAVYGKICFAGTSSGIYASRTMGTSWENCSPNLGRPITALAVCGENLFAGTSNIGSWRRPLREMLTGIESKTGLRLTNFSLNQNYPNPFNPSTTISFSLLSKSHVSLKIFDVMGREVASVVSLDLQAGNYSRQWNASGYPSGVYFYRLQAGAYTETKRLVLLQ